MGVCACLRREEWAGPKGPPPATQMAAPPTPSAPTIGLLTIAHPRGPHPRILATEGRLAALRGLRAASAPSWRALLEQCDGDARHPIEAGYEGWDWANAALDLALCHAMTGRPEHARAAIQYFKALLDDARKVGDGAGGDAIVRHDDGYSIRTRGCLGAIAYDWLHDAPGMTSELRGHAVDRIVAWTQWFSAGGYNRDQPIANYYAGWFGAVAFGGIAADGDDPRSALLLDQAERMFNAEIVPAFRRKLAGGDFPEGWQYGDLVGAVLTIFADAEIRPDAAGRSPFDELPWLHETPAYRAHALWPDGRHTFDTGDWSEKPAVAPTHTLLALSTVLPNGDAAGRQSRALARLAADPREEWHWLAALADDPSRVAEDPRRGPTSYLSPGTATWTARTDWSAQAVWVAMTSAPSLSDHQHLDAGHFEVVRGGDALVVDAGGYGSYSSLSHNVIAVDDGKDNDNYSPNQGTWSDRARIARFEDQGRFVYAMADYASAYDPAGYPKDHPRRSVEAAVREILFSRRALAGLPESARVIVHDRMTVGSPGYGVTFLLHGGARPEPLADGVRFVVGKSMALVTTMTPAGASPALVREPTDLGDGPYYANDPPEGAVSVRVEVRSARQGVERRFLHAFVVAGTDAHPPHPARVEGQGIDGVAIDDEAYVFALGSAAGPAALTYRAPVAAARHVVASLPPDAPYALRVERDGDSCRVSLDPAPSGTERSRRSSPAGVLTLEVAPGCRGR
jgi:Heparinase II/III-like protein